MCNEVVLCLEWTDSIRSGT